jgi:ABC-type antimicrobial peptide transport system permease subunit
MIKLIFKFLLRNKLKNMLLFFQFTLSFLALFMLTTETVNIVKSYTTEIGYDVKNLIGGSIGTTWKVKTENEFKELKSEMLSAIGELRELPYVKAAGYIFSYPYSNMRRVRNKSGYSRAEPEAIKALGLELVDGRLFTEDDAFSPIEDLVLINQKEYEDIEAKRPKEKIIGGNYYQLTNDDTTTVKNVGKIVGVIKEYKMYGRFNSDYEKFYITVSKLANDDHFKDNWNRIRNNSCFVIRIDGSVSVSKAMFEINKIYTKNIQNRDIRLYSIEQRDELFSQGPKRNFTILFFICLILIFIISIGVIAMTKESLMKRTKEIGIRMALGSKENQVMMAFLSELLILTILAGVFSSAIVFTSSHYEIIKFKKDLLIFIISFLTLLIIVVTSVFNPIRKASKQKPNIALHYE